MKFIFYIALLLPLLIDSSNTTYYSMLKKRQYGDDKTRLMAYNQEKKRLLSSDGTEASSTVDIDIQAALNYHKIKGIIVDANQSFRNIFLRPTKEYVQPGTLLNMKPLRYINSANGLNTLPLTYTETSILIPITIATDLMIYKTEVNAIQLQNTNIHTIYPYQLKNYPNLKTIILPEGTPESSRQANSKRNPNITFMYKPMSARFRAIKP